MKYNSEKLKKNLDFVIDYRKTCDVIVSYVVKKNGSSKKMIMMQYL